MDFMFALIKAFLIFLALICITGMVTVFLVALGLETFFAAWIGLGCAVIVFIMALAIWVECGPYDRW